MRPLFLVLLTAMATSAQAADLQPKTVAAFDRYVQATERRMADAAEPFLRIDGLPEAQRKAALAALGTGEFVIDSIKTTVHAKRTGPRVEPHLQHPHRPGR
jgi:hypothetical protein